MDYLRGKLRGKTPSWGRESEADTRGETEQLSYTNIFIPNTLSLPPSLPPLAWRPGMIRGKLFLMSGSSSSSLWGRRDSGSSLSSLWGRSSKMKPDKPNLWTSSSSSTGERGNSNCKPYKLTQSPKVSFSTIAT